MKCYKDGKKDAMVSSACKFVIQTLCLHALLDLSQLGQRSSWLHGGESWESGTAMVAACASSASQHIQVQAADNEFTLAGLQ